MYMLYTASYILNNTSKALQYPIHPFCHSLSNIGTAEGATREIPVPDVIPSQSTNMDLSMAAGDFLEIYNDDEGVSGCIIGE
jgi:carnosine N-methyltransferase